MTTPEQLRTAIQRYEQARPAMRDAMHKSAVQLAHKLTEERDALVTRLDKRWSWCDANEGHPQFIDREDAVLADIETYTAIEDALRDAANVLYGVAA